MIPTIRTMAALASLWLAVKAAPDGEADELAVAVDGFVKRQISRFRLKLLIE